MRSTGPSIVDSGCGSAQTLWSPGKRSLNLGDDAGRLRRARVCCVLSLAQKQRVGPCVRRRALRTLPKPPSGGFSFGHGGQGAGARLIQVHPVRPGRHQTELPILARFSTHASRRSTSMVHTNEKGSPSQAIKPSTGAFAIATRAGVYETSKRLPRWRNPLDSRLRLLPKCRQTI